MALYWTDFSEYTVGQQPSDWTQDWSNVASPTVEDVSTVGGGSASGDVVLFDETGGFGDPNGAGSLLYWDTIASDQNAVDTEIVLKMRSGADSGNNPNLKGAVRGSDPDGGDGEVGYFFQFFPSSGDVQIRRVNAPDGFDTGDILAQSSITMSNGENGWYWFRFRINGQDLKLKLWADGDAEPSSWTIEITDDSVDQLTTGSWSGPLFSTGFNSFDAQVDIFGAGTGGDTAPMEEPTGGGGATTVNVEENTGTETNLTNQSSVFSSIIESPQAVETKNSSSSSSLNLQDSTIVNDETTLISNVRGSISGNLSTDDEYTSLSTIISNIVDEISVNEQIDSDSQSSSSISEDSSTVSDFEKGEQQKTNLLNASDYNVGDTEADIPELQDWFDSEGVTVQEDSYGEKYFHFDVDGDDPMEWVHGLTLNGVIEIQMKFKSDNENDSRTLFKGSGTSKSDLTALSPRHRNDRFAIDQYVNGTFTNIDSQSKVLDNLRRYRIQYNVDNGEYKEWVWDAIGGTEPSTPDIDVTISDYADFTGDKIGWMCYLDQPHVYWIGLGVESEPAPTVESLITAVSVSDSTTADGSILSISSVGSSILESILSNDQYSSIAEIASSIADSIFASSEATNVSLVRSSLTENTQAVDDNPEQQGLAIASQAFSEALTAGEEWTNIITSLVQTSESATTEELMQAQGDLFDYASVSESNATVSDFVAGLEIASQISEAVTTEDTFNLFLSLMTSISESIQTDSDFKAIPSVFSNIVEVSNTQENIDSSSSVSSVSNETATANDSINQTTKKRRDVSSSTTTEVSIEGLASSVGFIVETANTTDLYQISVSTSASVINSAVANDVVGFFSEDSKKYLVIGAVTLATSLRSGSMKITPRMTVGKTYIDPKK